MQIKTKKKLLMWTLICFGVAIFYVFYTFVPAHKIVEKDEKIVYITIFSVENLKDDFFIQVHKKKTLHQGEDIELQKFLSELKLYRQNFGSYQMPAPRPALKDRETRLNVHVKKMDSSGNFSDISLDIVNYYGGIRLLKDSWVDGKYYIPRPYFTKEEHEEIFDYFYDFVKNEQPTDLSN